MRHISFSLTEKAFLDGSKDVTRRLGWRVLRRGDRLMAVRKSMGLAKGERVKKLGEIEAVSVSLEALDSITDEDVVREGFPEMSAAGFVRMFCKHLRCNPWTIITRIEFRRVP